MRLQLIGRIIQNRRDTFKLWVLNCRIATYVQLRRLWTGANPGVAPTFFTVITDQVSILLLCQGK